MTLLLMCFMGLIEMTHGQNSFNGIEVNLSNLFRLSDAKTRSISPENRTGEKGKGGMATLENGTAARAARDLGQGWKVNPYLVIPSKETVSLAEIEGPGAIQHIWITQNGINRNDWRKVILRFYWDNEKTPSVEVPMGDFFGNGWQEPHEISSLAVCVNPLQAFNCYWVMPFREKCKITLENIADNEIVIYYQIDYALTEIPDDAAYFHAQFRRVNPLPLKEDFTMIDGIKGQGQYVGCTMAWETSDDGWWGEGEVKFFIDGDQKFPTICGTGTEDYFCGSHGFLVNDTENKRIYKNYSTPYAGFYVAGGGEFEKPKSRFDLYRWHITDPVRFENDLKITVQALGWDDDRRYLPLQEDISSVVFWYQKEPHNPFPKLPSLEELEID